jgi:hypothetical protein
MGSIRKVRLALLHRPSSADIPSLPFLSTFSSLTDLMRYPTPSFPALAEDLKKICASSTTVTPLSSAPTKANLVEVLVQGTHANTVLDLLAKAGVPRRYVKTEKGK